MATDFNKPIVTDAYADILPGLVTANKDLARMLEPTLTGTSANVPTGAVRWNAATIRWERYNGTSWVTLPAAGDNIYAISISGNAATAAACSGNAATATKLATARTIGGVSFDGSANINLPGVNSQGNQNTTGNAANLTPNPAGYTHIGEWGQPGGAANTFLVNRAYMSDTCTGNAATATLATTAANALGVGQTRQNLTSIRALNTYYTNSTGRAIYILVSVFLSEGSLVTLEASANGSGTNYGQVLFSSTAGFSQYYSVGVLILPGDQYKVYCSSGTLSTWTEIR